MASGTLPGSRPTSRRLQRPISMRAAHSQRTVAKQRLAARLDRIVRAADVAAIRGRRTPCRRANLHAGDQQGSLVALGPAEEALLHTRPLAADALPQ